MASGSPGTSGGHDLRFKIVLVGDHDVGKQEILRRYVDNVFQGRYVTTVAVDLKVKTVEVDGKKIKLQLWDTVGNDRFRSLITSYFRGAQGVMLVYDVASERSFYSIRDWVRQLEQYATPEAVRMIIGNRCDQESRTVSTENGQELADELGFRFFEISPRTGKNVSLAFTTLTREIMGKMDDKNVPGRPGRTITLGESTVERRPPKHPSESCCF